MAPGPLVALLLALEAPASLVVSTGGDVQAPCPAASLLATTLRRRLPEVRVATDASVRAGDLGVSLSAQGDRWRLRVEDPTGEPMLARELRPAEPSCAAVAETATFILDRFLTGISWRGQQPRLQPDSLAARGERGRSGTGLSLGAGLAAWTELPWSAAPALAVDLSLRAGRLILGLWGAAPPAERMAVRIREENRGTLYSSQALLGGSLGACRPALVSLCGGLLAGAGVVAGKAEGLLFDRRPGRSLVPALGAFGRLIWPLGAGFELDLDAAALAPLGRAQVGVEGTGAVRRSARVYGLYSVRLGWGFP